MAETGTTIQDCVNFGVVTGSGTSNGAGGIVGKRNGANLLRCANYGGVAPTQSWHTGGVVGMASTGSITDCYNVATVTGGRPRYDKSGVGGIVGHFNECTITNNYNYGTVSRNKDSVDCAMGGAIGFDRKSGTGTPEKVAAKAENSGSIRFCYGISADQYGSAAGKRLVSGVTSVTLTACAHTGKTAQVPEVPATCTETGLTAGVRCTDCGKVISGCETIPATGHDTELVGAMAATCTEDGYTGDEVCKVCQTVVKKGGDHPRSGPRLQGRQVQPLRR